MDNQDIQTITFDCIDIDEYLKTKDQKILDKFIESLHKETFAFVKWSGCTKKVYERLRNCSIDYLKEMKDLYESNHEEFEKRKEVRHDINYAGGLLDPKFWYFIEEKKQDNNFNPIDKPNPACYKEQSIRFQYWMRHEAGLKKDDLDYLQQDIKVEDNEELNESIIEYGQQIKNLGEIITQMLDAGLKTGDFFKKLQEQMEIGVTPGFMDLSKHEKDDTLVIYHRDTTFLTIHGKSTYPCLQVWIEGKKYILQAPKEHCYLVNCGICIQSLTGGYLRSGWHEIVYNKLAQAQYDREVKEGTYKGRLNISTFFEPRSNVCVRPLKQFENDYKEVYENSNDINKAIYGETSHKAEF